MTAKKKPDPDKPKTKPKKGAKAKPRPKNDLGQTVSQHNVPLGRPRIEVTPEMLAKGRDYLLFGYENQNEVIPTFAGLGCWLGLSKRAVTEIALRDADFCDLKEDIQTKQETMLISGGLRSDFNPTISKLVLSKHGYNETLEHSTDPNNPIQTKGELLVADMAKGKLIEHLAQYGIIPQL